MHIVFIGKLKPFFFFIVHRIVATVAKTITPYSPYCCPYNSSP